MPAMPICRPARKALARAVDQRLRQAQRALQRQQLERAAKGFLAVLAVAPDDPNAQRGREQVLQAVLARSQIQADDFQFDAAQRDAALAKQLGASQAIRQQLAQRLQRARQARQALQQPAISTAQRERQLRDHLRKIERARAGQWISPPGHSAFDALREAQSLAPRDSRVKAAAARACCPPVAAASTTTSAAEPGAGGRCLPAGLADAVTHRSGLPAARQRLAQRWLAIGSERLGNGDVAFAERAPAGGRAGVGRFQQRVPACARLRDIVSSP
jgi:hypothetical protein